MSCQVSESLISFTTQLTLNSYLNTDRRPVTTLGDNVFFLSLSSLYLLFVVISMITQNYQTIFTVAHTRISRIFNFLCLSHTLDSRRRRRQRCYVKHDCFTTTEFVTENELKTSKTQTLKRE